MSTTEHRCPTGRHPEPARACYCSHKCRCAGCRAVVAAYEKARVRRLAYGRPTLVDAEPVREHLAWLAAQGVSVKQVARLTGIGQGTLSKIVYGTGGRITRRVRPATRDAILAVRPGLEVMADSRLVDATGTRRRLQALVACGWSRTRLDRELGVQAGQVWAIAAGRRDHVEAATARAVRDLYERLWDQAPPVRSSYERGAVARTRREARGAGWAPPMAWDEEALDDPAAVPDLGEAVRTTPAGLLPIDLDDVAHLARFGVGRAEAQERLGVTWEALVRACRRHGRMDLVEHIQRNDVTAGRMDPPSERRGAA